MRTRHFLCVASAAMLVIPFASAQETRPEEIVVTSTALRETALEMAQPALVLSGDTLRRQIATSIGETIANELGVNATYFGPSSSRPVIRGLGGARVLVLQDGISSLDVSSLSQDHAVAVESVLADQIEILKGPATLLFGSGAVGGVVNIVDGRIPTRFSKDENRGAVEIRGDTAIEERTAVARLELGSDSLRLHVDGYRRETGDVDIPGYAFSAAEREEHRQEDPDDAFVRGSLENSDSENQGGAFGISAGTQDRFVGVSWSRYETGYGIPAAHHEHASEEEHVHEDEHEAHESAVRIDMQQDRYDLKAEQAMGFGALERIRLRGAYNDYVHRELEADEVGTRFEQDAFDVRFNVDHGELAGWRGTFGAHYVNIDFAAFGAEAFVPASLTEQFALFVFEKRQFGPLSVEVGARAERQQIEPDAIARAYDETASSFSAGAVWQFVGDYAMALSLTRSQRHPQSAELYANGAHLAIGRHELGNEELKKETASTIDLTLHRHPDEGVHWSIGAFYNDFTDYIFTIDTLERNEGLPVFRYMQSDAEFYGLEGEITVPVYRGSGSEFEIRLASDYVRGRLADGGDLPQIPPLRYGIELHYERGAMHFGLETFRHTDQNKIAAEERSTPGYTMLDADASYRLELGKVDLMIFIRGSNLLDEDARRHTSPLKEIAPLPGRSMHVGARAEF